MKYLMSKGAAISDEAVAALEEIEKQDGSLLPKAVVRKARPEKSPLHAYFEWNDGTAADEYRLIQARNLIHTVTVVIENDGEQIKSQKYVSLPSDRLSGNGYRSMSKVMNDEDLKAELLSTALKELQEFQERYKNLKELAVVFEAIGRVKKKAA